MKQPVTHARWQSGRSTMRLIRHQLGMLTPDEQMECYRATRRAYEDGTGSLEDVRAAVTPAVAARISLEEQAAARRKREAAEEQAAVAVLRVREAQARQAGIRAARRAAFLENARFAVLVLGSGLALTAGATLGVVTSHVLHSALNPAAVTAPAEQFTSSGMLVLRNSNGMPVRMLRVRMLRVTGITGYPGAAQNRVWWTADDGSTGVWAGRWSFFPDYQYQPPSGSDMP